MTITRIIWFITGTLLVQSAHGASLYFKPLPSANFSSNFFGSPLTSQEPGKLTLESKERFRRSGRLLGLKISRTPCAVNQCRNKGECTTNVQALGGFACKCRPGYYGVLCDVVTPDCESNPCKHGAICVVTDTGFRCDCKSGYSGVTCEFDGYGNPIPPKGSQSTLTITIVSIAMGVMLLLGIFLFVVEQQRDRLRRFNEEYKGEIRFKTDTLSVLLVMLSELRECILGHADRSRGERRTRGPRRLLALKKHEEAQAELDQDSETSEEEKKKVKDKKKAELDQGNKPPEEEKKSAKDKKDTAKSKMKHKSRTK